MNNEEHNDEYFINRNIFKSGVTTDDSEYSRTGKALWIFIPLILSFLIIGIIIALTQSFLAGIPATLACLIAYVYILRKMVFDENQFKRLVAKNELNKNINLGYFNNLLAISDDMQMFFQTSKKGLKTSYLVTFDYASLFDETANANENTIANAYIPFLKKLHDLGFDFNLYDISMKNKISVGTLDLVLRTRKLSTKESWLQLVLMLQNETISSLEQNGSAKYRIFIEVENTKYQNVANFRELVEDVIKSTLSTQTTLVHPHIADRTELVNFMINYFQIDSFPIENISRNIRAMNIDKYFNFRTFFDINGIEYKIDDFDPQFTNQTNKKMNIEREKHQLVNNELNAEKKAAPDLRKKEQEKQREEFTQKRNQEIISRKKGIFRPGTTTKKKQQQDLLKAKQEKLNNEKVKQQEFKQQKLDRAKRNSANGPKTLSDMLNEYEDK